MRQYSIEPRTENVLKDMYFYHLWGNNKKLLDTGLHSTKTASKKVFDEAGEFLRNEIAVTKSNDDKIMRPDENPRNVEKKMGRSKSLSGL